MSYDKNSFLAGITVGAQLKGWASADGIGGGDLVEEIEVRSGHDPFWEETPEGYYGIKKVKVLGDGNLEPKNIRKGISILGVTGIYSPTEIQLEIGNKKVTANGNYTFYPSDTAMGFDRVNLIVEVPTEVVSQPKTVTPRRTGWILRPDEGYNALSEVVVTGDSKFVAENIKKDVTIFGVTGNYEGVVDAKLGVKNDIVPRSYSQTFNASSYGYDGFSSVKVSGDSNLISSNIREGVSIFGINGSYSTDQKYEIKENIMPTRYGVQVSPSAGYNALARVHVKGDDNLTSANIAKGVSIFGVIGEYESPTSELTVVPSLGEQLIKPTDGSVGFSVVKVLPAEASGDYNDGYAAGVASKEEEINELKQQILLLTEEKEKAYEEGYNNGYSAGQTSYDILDEEVF